MGNIVKPAIVLFVVCLVVSAALAFTNSITRDKIEERASLDAENARKEVLADAESFKLVDDIDSIIEQKPDLSIVKEAYTGIKGSETAGYVFLVESKGYGGEISITVGIDKDGKITGVKIGDNKETPGLGSKASDDKFRSQLEDFVPSGPLAVVKGKKTTNPEEIEAISGATITSRAVVKAVQAAVDMSAELRKEGGSSK